MRCLMKSVLEPIGNRLDTNELVVHFTYSGGIASSGIEKVENGFQGEVVSLAKKSPLYTTKLGFTYNALVFIIL